MKNSPPQTPLSTPALEQALHAVADKVRKNDLALGRECRNYDFGTNNQPFLHLFHAPFSLCSHKVRSVFFEHQIPFTSYPLSLFPKNGVHSENYYPEFLNLRLLGRSPDSMDEGLSESFSGASSVTQEGFDPCVVPVLVDLKNSQVVTDSLAICLYLDKHYGNSRLISDDSNRASEVESQLRIVDETPHVALLYGANPDRDERPAPMQQMLVGIHAKKVSELLYQLSELGSEDRHLEPAYQAKIAKEKSAGEFVADPEKMRVVISRTREILLQLEKDIAQGDDWILPGPLSMADLFWAISLYRLQWLGYSHFWNSDDSLPKVAAFASRAFELDCVRKAVIEWPGMPPSQHTQSLLN
ncbi:glutathione S-transferase family protein [Haliea sp.]